MRNRRPLPLLPFVLLACALALLAQGCVVTARYVPPPHHRPPAPSPYLSDEEIADVAIEIARERGYRDFHIEELEREDGHRWEVEIEGWVDGSRSELKLVLDGRNGVVLEIRDKRSHGGRGRGHGRGGR